MIAGLLAAGTPLAPVMVFLVTSPLMSPSIFMVTVGGLGLEMALTRVLAAVLMGLAAGLLTHLLTAGGWLRNQVRLIPSEAYPAASSHDRARPTLHAGLARMARQSWAMAGFIGKYLLLALALEALMVRYLPAEWISGWLGTRSGWSVLISAAVGLPAYVNGFAAVPLLRGLMDLGMDKGAVLAFLIAGPMASIPSVAGAAALVRARTLALFLSIGFSGAVAMGYAYRLIP